MIMRVLLYGVLLVALLSACATGTGGGGIGGNDEAAGATAAWRAAYNSRDPARITAMYDSDAVLWGTTAKTVAPNPVQSPSISRMPESARAQELPSANSTFGFMVTLRSIGVTTPSLMFKMARKYRVLRAIPWCSEIETESGSSWLTIHRAYHEPFFHGIVLPSNNAFEDGRLQASL
jgi:hypothetical protein